MFFGLMIVTITLMTPTFTIARSNQEIKHFTSDLEPGDILFMDVRPIWLKFFPYSHINGYSNDHCALYVGKPFGFKWFVESSNYSIIGIIKYIDGVQLSPMLWLNIIFTNFTYAKVNSATDNQKQQAIKFSIKQIPEPYQVGWASLTSYDSWHANPDLTDPMNPFYEKYYYPDDPYIDYWTCAELVWAAYLHQGIELDSTPNLIYDPIEEDYFYYVGTNDIRNSENVTMYEYQYTQ